MSARTPFVPQASATASHEEPSKDTAKDAADTSQIRFPPVASNPLQAARHASMKKQANRSSEGFTPLKTNSFGRTHTPGAESKPRNSFSSFRPGSARPSLTQTENDSYMHAPLPMRSGNSHSALFNDNSSASTAAEHNDDAHSSSAPRGKTYQSMKSTTAAATYEHGNQSDVRNIPLDAHISNSPDELQSNRKASAPSKRAQKRFHAEIDAEDPFSASVDAIPSPKVRRGLQVEQPRYSTTSPMRSSPPLEQYTQPGYTSQQYHQASQDGYNHPGSGLTYDRDMMIPPSSPPAQASQPAGTGALTRLIGRDADLYVEDHMGKYDAAVTRWTNCTVDEWKEGADELMGKCTKLFDFVKERMEGKLRLYAEFTESTDKHKKVLEDREAELQRVKEGLVKGSGSLLGNGFSA